MPTRPSARLRVEFLECRTLLDAACGAVASGDYDEWEYCQTSCDEFVVEPECDYLDETFCEEVPDVPEAAAVTEPAAASVPAIVVPRAVIAVVQPTVIDPSANAAIIDEVLSDVERPIETPAQSAEAHPDDVAFVSTPAGKPLAEQPPPAIHVAPSGDAATLPDETLPQKTPPPPRPTEETPAPPKQVEESEAPAPRHADLLAAGAAAVSSAVERVADALAEPLASGSVLLHWAGVCGWAAGAALAWLALNRRRDEPRVALEREATP